MAIRNGRLLFVGDSGGQMAGLLHLLDEAGYDVKAAASGQAAFNLLRNEASDIVFLDLRSPDIDGSQFLATLRADEGLCDLPVILFARGDDPGALEECLAAGAEDYLLTPVSPALLKAQVSEYLEISWRRQEARDRASREELLKIERDLQVAHRIQEGFLPKELPHPEGWEVAASFTPAREVAGDFYDAFMLSQNRRMGFVIADVVDKGVPAALFMGLVRSLTRAFAQQNYSLSWTNVLEAEGSDTAGAFNRSRGRTGGIPSTGTTALQNAVLLTNNYIVENHIDLNMFATLFFGLLDPATGRLAYINAGHNPPFILGPDGALKATLKGTGPAVGMFPAENFRIAQAQIDPGDILYAYTDGVTEARDPSRGFFTEKRLQALLSQPVDSAAGLGEAVQGRVILIPSSIKAGEIARVLREGYDVGLLNDGFQSLVEELDLDVLMIDTHPGLNEETLLSLAVSDVLAIVMRPDQQDYQGTGVTVEVARKLEVPRILLVVNKCPAAFDAAEVKARVERTYNSEVAAVLPHSEELMTLASAGIFVTQYPDHPVTALYRRVASSLMAP